MPPLHSQTMKVTLCDVRDPKGQPCGERASVEVRLRWSDKNWVLDACDRHSKELTANAREEEPPPSSDRSVTRLPRAEPKEKANLYAPYSRSDFVEWATPKGINTSRRPKGSDVEAFLAEKGGS